MPNRVISSVIKILPTMPKVSVYVLVAIVRKRLGLEASLYQVLQILSLRLFEKTPILCALQGIDHDANLAENANQLILFDHFATAEAVAEHTI